MLPKQQKKAEESGILYQEDGRKEDTGHEVCMRSVRLGV